ncbi:hypothetical protein XU18_0601 [Perkinsela sp. CCAP 1560/4]|nr:hypothetical protein XU18_0601 [Perkinsela sp. CCAP 1560/4]|eukprot:KNH09091.1 hypothetical protein XU18_0601 [Perkinsela sp. CCAP 1560/4]
MRMTSVDASMEESLPKMNLKEVTERIKMAYDKALGGAIFSTQECVPFFVLCANLSGELSNQNLMRVIYLLVVNQCLRDDVLHPIWHAINRRMNCLSTSDICRLLYYFASLTGREHKIIRSLSTSLISQCEELSYDDIIHALRGLHAVEKDHFIRRMFDILFRKFMEEANEIERVSFTDVILVFDVAEKHAVSLPKHFIHTLVQYAGFSIRRENIPRIIIDCFVRFIQAGITKPQELMPFTQEMNVTVRVMNLASVISMLDVCANLDEPMIDLILALLKRAVYLVQAANFQQCVSILSFLSKLVGSEHHPVIHAIASRIYELSDIFTPEDALQLVQLLLKLHSQHHSALIRLSYIIVKRRTKDLSTANAIARICLEASCCDGVLVDFYIQTVDSALTSSTAKDLIIIYQTIVALRIDAAALQTRILRLLRDHMEKRIKIKRQLPWHFIKAVKDFQDAAATRGMEAYQEKSLE